MARSLAALPMLGGRPSELVVSTESDRSAPNIVEGRPDYYAGIDVSLECSSVCIVDGSGRIVREEKVASEPETLIAWLGSRGSILERIGLEAGPLSQWLYAALREAGLA